MWKNLLSYGNKLQSYEFTDKPKLVLIEGENGTGKSTIKEAITISAYGKSNIRKMKDLPNWINKSAYTYNEIETVNGDTIIVERGIDPNFTNIKINGVSHNLPDKRKIDDFIENEVLNINFSTFCNTISLSFDDFKSFINLGASDKRKIVDPIFGIDILSDMKSDIKDDYSNSKKKLDIINSNISKNTDLLDTSISQLSDLRKKLEIAAIDKSDEIKSDIKVKKANLESHKSKFNNIKENIVKVRSKLSKLNENIAEHNSKINEFSNKLKIFNKNRCPHCLSDLTGSAAIKIKDVICNKITTEEKLCL